MKAFIFALLLAIVLAVYDYGNFAPLASIAFRFVFNLLFYTFVFAILGLVWRKLRKRA